MTTMHARGDTAERGFTLIEVMIVVGLIAILAAVVIPTFFTESARSKAEAEVSVIFSELRTKEESYKVENGVYLSTGADEDDLFPATPSSSAQAFQTVLPTEWVALRFAAPQKEVYCSYVAIAGTKDDEPGTRAQGFGMTDDPEVSWYYLLARCNMDGNSSRDAYYFTSSMDTRIQDFDSGH
jgi:prepilin-type N-terminal cleavage/methylation domain-containing protein